MSQPERPLGYFMEFRIRVDIGPRPGEIGAFLSWRT